MLSKPVPVPILKHVLLDLKYEFEQEKLRVIDENSLPDIADK